jgi:putative hydrolase of the HAD superfamily
VVTEPPDRPYDVLLLDFGGVCLLNPVERHRAVESRLGLPAGSLTWRGPLDPDGDDLYAQSIGEGGISERQYWSMRAAEVGRAAGVDLDVEGYMRLAFWPASADLIRPEATDVVERAQARGIGVSVLTNDLRAFHGDDWVDAIGFLHRVDHLIDLSHAGFLKPDPRAYQLALDTLGDVDPARVLFVDDQPLNVTGAERAGITGMWFDIKHAAASWRSVGRRLQL